MIVTDRPLSVAEPRGDRQDEIVVDGYAGQEHASSGTRGAALRAVSSGTISALPNSFSTAFRRHPDVDPILTRSLRDFAVGDDPAGKDLVSRPGKRLTGGDLSLLVIREVEEPWVSGHGFLIGESPAVAIPLRGAR